MEAQKLKQLGNNAYKEKDFATALKNYGKAIQLEPKEITYYLNIAAVHFSMKNFPKCVMFCLKACKIGQENGANPNLIAKGYARKGRAHKEMGDLKMAKFAFEKALKENKTSEYEESLTEIESALKHCQMAKGLRPSNEKTKTVDEKRKKTMMKEITESLAKLKAMPLPMKVLVKIFNFLPNHDIRCGISLACKTFYKICQNKSLVPVKDLCIYGHPVGPKRYCHQSKKNGKRYYCLSLRSMPAESDIMSQNLISLKIKAVNPETVNELVFVALQACPKLTNLEIIETQKQIGEYFECNISFLALDDTFLISICIKNSRFEI